MLFDSYSRIITLTTDFGLADHYVAAMKGVILSRCPQATIVDVSHEIPPFSLYAAAYTIAQAASCFPAGTVHVVVVDPGVGTARRGLLISASGQWFIGPDNGVFSLIAAQQLNLKIWELANHDLWLPDMSDTFHGRDVFAPVAAAIACGTATPEQVGPLGQTLEVLPDLEPAETEPGVWRGRVLSVDRFGNVITNFEANRLPEIASRNISLSIRHRKVNEFRKTFGDSESGLCFVYIGSSGYLELGINRQSAAEWLEARPGDSILLTDVR
jgi:S-adenosyl-L-methionine hydrolase (adenosine-forming)